MIIYDITSGYHFDVENGLIHGMWKNKYSKRDKDTLIVDRLETTTERTSLVPCPVRNNNVLAVDAFGVLSIWSHLLDEYQERRGCHPADGGKKALQAVFSDKVDDALRTVRRLLNRIFPASPELEALDQRAFNLHPRKWLDAMAQVEYGRLNRS